MVRRLQFICLLLSVSVVLPALCQVFQQSQANIETRVDSLLKQLTLEEKIDLIGGVDDFYIREIKHIGLPRLKMADGPIGVRNYGPSTVFAGIGLAATWDPELARRIGTVIGQDARARGVHFMLGPGVNIYRAPMNGRNFEYFGEDPFLAGAVAAGYTTGNAGIKIVISNFVRPFVCRKHLRLVMCHPILPTPQAALVLNLDLVSHFWLARRAGLALFILP